MSIYKGFSNQKKKGIAQFGTVHPVNSNAFAESVIPKYLFEASSELSILSVVDVFGPSGQVEYWEIELSSAGMKEGDVLRMASSSSLPNFEFDIMQLASTTKARVFPISNTKPLLTDTVFVMGWVTAKSDINGNMQVSVTAAPTSFLLDGATQTVEQDTTTPADTKALPSLAFIYKDGEQVPVTKDTATPANTIAVPIESQEILDALVYANSNTDVIATDTGNMDVKLGFILNFASSTNNLTNTVVASRDKQDVGNASLSSIDTKTIEDGAVVTSNSTTSPLGAGGVFTGPAFEILKYSVVNVGLISDVASATNGVKLEVSPDGINWDHSHSTTYAGGNGVGYIFNCEFKFARVVYTNGPTAQTVFRLQTIVKKNFTKQSLYTIDQAVSGNMFVELGKNVIIGKTTAGGGGFVDVKVTPSGALTTETTLGAGTNNIGDVDVASLPVSFDDGATDATTQRVVIANDQTVPVSVSNLPPALGQTTASASLSVTLASDYALPAAPVPTALTVKNATVTVGLTAIRATTDGSAPSATRRKLIIFNDPDTTTGKIYIGSSTVTALGSTKGIQIFPGVPTPFENDANDYYIISDTASNPVAILEVE